MLNLGTIGFGVTGDTSNLDKNLDKSEKKINRFTMLGLRAFNNLNSTNTSKATKEIDNLNSRLDKTQREANRTMQQIKILESEMNNAKLKIADSKGLNLEYNNPTTAGQMSKNEYNSKLDSLALEDKEYAKLLDKQIKLVEKSEEQGFKISELNNKLQQANVNLEQTSNKSNKTGASFEGISNRMKGIASGLGGAVSKTLKWGVTLLGIGTALGAIRKGVSSYLNNNEQLKANLDYMTFAIGQALAPAIQFVVNLMMDLLGIVGAIAQVFFGVNLFANSVSAYMDSANKSSSGMKKNLGSLAGFDEVNNVGGNDGSSVGTTMKMPDFNLNDKVTQWTNKIGPQLKIVKATFEDLWNYLKLGAGMLWVGLQAVFFIGSNAIAGIMQGLAEILASIIVSVIDIIVGLFKGLWQMVSGLIQGIVQIIVATGQGIWQIVSGVFTSIFEMIKGIFTGIIQFIVGIFTGNFKMAIQGLVTIFSSIWNGLKGIVSSVFGGIWTIITGIFNGIATFIKGVVNGLITMLTSLVRGVCNIFIGIFNGVIKVINGFIRGINMIKIPDWVPIFGGRGFNIKQLGTINYFANGGVLTKPTMGIMGEYANARSNPEIVTPQNIMYQTVADVMRDNNYSSNDSKNSNQPINLTVQFADRTIFEEFIDYANTKSRRNGVSVFAEV